MNMTSERQAYVYIQLAGTLESVPAALLKVEQRRDGTYVGRFRYGDRYLERPDAVEFDPFELGPNLEHARRACLRRRKNGPKIQIVSKGDITIASGPFKNGPVGRPRIAKPGPVNRIQACRHENLHPSGGKVHVDDKLHREARGSSFSSARQAA